jgi:hypothetical protein
MVKVGVFLLLPFAFLLGCRKSYKEVEQAELAKKIRYDSVFQGVYLGMPRDEFRAHCLKMNQVGKFKEGAMAKVQFVAPVGPDSVVFLFYPDFVNDLISEVPVLAQYKAWSPWNDELSGVVLEKKIKEFIISQIGGNSFQPIYGASDKVAWVKVDGNRRITVYRMEDDYVKIIYKDLLVQQDQP